MKDVYFVALKLFLRKGNNFLILKDSFGDWDLPGGRILPNEFTAPFEKIIARKMKEELGPIEYKLGKPVVFMRHERKEKMLGKDTSRIFAIGYEAQLKSGMIKLSSRHREFKWVPLKTFNPSRYFKGGWLRGVRDYLRLRRI